MLFFIASLAISSNPTRLGEPIVARDHFEVVYVDQQRQFPLETIQLILYSSGPLGAPINCVYYDDDLWMLFTESSKHGDRYEIVLELHDEERIKEHTFVKCLDKLRKASQGKPTTFYVRTRRIKPK